MSAPQYLMGLDLGTTHIVVVYARLDQPQDRVLWRIPQWTQRNQIESLPYLPSFRYHPSKEESAQFAEPLPWPVVPVEGDFSPVVIGQWARVLQGSVPQRTVHSAKSWLSQPLVDRLSPILPWGDFSDVARVSPVVATASYLAYLRDAWNAEHPDALFQTQEIVLTLPASFDEVARMLTLKAVDLAGLTSVRLLEEPQAAFYDWIATHHHADCTNGFHFNRAPQNTLNQNLPQQKQKKWALVCDVGGGTTDFSLIEVVYDAACDDVQYKRVAVGEHLLLGGDNLDYALVYYLLQEKLGEKNAPSATRLNQWLSALRRAKEVLLSDAAPDELSVSVLGGGTNLFRGLQSCVLSKEEVTKVLLSGFFPSVDFYASPIVKKAALADLNLNFAQDPAITRHLAEFLRQHQVTAETFPELLLLNGGVFKSPILAEALFNTLCAWRSQLNIGADSLDLSSSMVWLHHERPDSAVAFGAVAFGLARLGVGKTIGGGVARSYFLLVESELGEKVALCVLPKGTEWGTKHTVAKKFLLRVGILVRFHLLHTSEDRIFHAGDLVAPEPPLLSLAPLVTTIDAALEAGDTVNAGNAVDVRNAVDASDTLQVELCCELTDLGILKLSCVSLSDPSQSWDLTFELGSSLSQASQAQHLSSSVDVTKNDTSLPSGWASVVEEVDAVFGKGDKSIDAGKVKTFKNVLEKKLGARSEWNVVTLRALADLLIERMKNRRRSELHERIWLNVVGFCLRPGFGDASDEVRIASVWPIFEQGLQYIKETPSWSEWWVFWRRIAGGLDTSLQQVIYQSIQNDLLNDRAKIVEGRKKSFDDICRLAGSLERISLVEKNLLLDHLQKKLQKNPEMPVVWWVMGRLLNRVPFYGSVEGVIDRARAEQALEFILTVDWKKTKSAQITAALLARFSGHVAIDLPLPMRQRVLAQLQKVKAPKEWIQLMTETKKLSSESWDIFYGEALPQGLLLLREG